MDVRRTSGGSNKVSFFFSAPWKQQQQLGEEFMEVSGPVGRWRQPDGGATGASAGGVVTSIIARYVRRLNVAAALLQSSTADAKPPST